MKPFEFTLDRERSLLRVKLCGFWDLPVMNEYEREYRTAFTQLNKLRPRPTYCLFDGSEYPVQSQSINRRHVALIEWLGPRQADRSALIVPNALVRLQVARSVNDERTQTFTSESKAMKWLACAPA